MKIKKSSIKKLFENQEESLSVQYLLTSVCHEIFKINRVKFSLSFILTLLFVANSTIGVAQRTQHSSCSRSNKRISGVVIDASNNEPIFGASVLLMESESKDDTENQSNQCCHGSATGIDGDFTLKIDSEIAKFIKVSYIGYKSQEIKIDYTGKPMKIALEPDCTHLDEIVVMGYTTTTKEKSTGSIATIKESVLVNSPTDNPITALQGRVPGVLITQSSGLPGSELNIQIRGRSTFATGTTSTDPLFVIDGMPFSNSTMSYWSLGSVGRVDPLSALNSADIERIDFLKDADATAIYGSKGANGVVLITTKKGKAGATKVSITADMGLSTAPKRIEFLNTEEYLAIREEAFIADGIEKTVDNAYDLLLWDPNVNTDWQEVMLGNTARSENIQASVSGGSRNTQFMFSAGYNNNRSVVLDEDSDKYLRMNARLNIQHKSGNEKFTANTSMGFSSVLMANKGVNPSTYLRSIPNMPLYDDNGDVYWLPGNDDFSAPLRIKSVSVENNIATFTGNMSLAYELINDLIAKTDFGYVRTNSSQIGKYGNGYLNPYNTGNSYRNRSLISEGSKDQVNFEPQLAYSNKHGKGNLTALLGMTFQSTNDKEVNVDLFDFPSESLMENAAAAERINNLVTASSDYRFTSVFARLGYEWRTRYFINGVFRRDGSSRFYSENQFGNFWSIAGAWIFSKDDMFKDESGVFSYGKIRASYGTTGNDGVGNYEYMSTYAFSSTIYNGMSGSYPDKLANDAFSWEVNKKFEIGLETAFLNSNITLDINYYNNRSMNQLISYPLASQTGFSSYRANLDALVVNRGFEIAINSINFERDGFRWSSNFNITIPKNKLLEFPDLEQSIYRDDYSIGRPLSVEWIYEFDKIDPETGIPLMVDQNNDGRMNEEDRVFKGDSEPIYYGGLSNTLSYKGFDLDFFFQFNRQPISLGYQYNYWLPLGMLYNYPKELAQDYWTPENKDASRPGITTSSSSDLYQSYRSYYTNSDAMFTDASYIKLKNVALSYTIPSEWSQRMNISVLKVYMNAQNLWTFTNFFGWDPETERTSVPPLRTITFGINVVI